MDTQVKVNAYMSQLVLLMSRMSRGMGTHQTFKITDADESLFFLEFSDRKELV